VALIDVLVSVREAVERQGQRHEELMTYLSHLPKAMELIPENSKLQAEALAAIRQHLENQGTQARQMSTILDKVGQAAVDQRRILDSVRQRLDMLAENDQKVAEHFSSFSSALVSSSDTTRIAGELLKNLELNIRTRDEALERILAVHQQRHTWMLAASILLSTAALIAVAVGLYFLARN
jgi:DNA repair ATPase RecN